MENEPGKIENREMLDWRFASLTEEKRTAKARSHAEELGACQTIAISRRIAETADRIRALPEGSNQLTRSQRGSEHWSHYDLAVHGEDANERITFTKRFLEKFADRSKDVTTLEPVDRQALVALGWMLGKFVWREEFLQEDVLPALECAVLLMRTTERLWKPESIDPRRICFRGLTRRIRLFDKMNRSKGMPVLITNLYVELCERALPFLEAAEFEHAPANEKMIKASNGRVKTFPSVYETAMSICNRAYRQNRSWNGGVTPSESMIDSLTNHLTCGKWLRLYCATWLSLVGRGEEAREHFRIVLHANRQAAWAWMNVGLTYAPGDETGVACLARALLCPTRENPMSRGIRKKLHKELARRLKTLGDHTRAAAETEMAITEESTPEAIAFYRTKASGAERLATAV